MKKIGIVGGVGWRSTVEYYSEICHRSEQLQVARDPKAVAAMPEIIIESLDLSRAVAYLGTEDDDTSWQQFDEYHRAALQRLEAGGADFALIATNTAHHRFDAIVHGIKIPVLSILDVAAKQCARIGTTELLILGTAVTMESATIREGFERHGIRAAGPQDGSVRRATISLISELQLGQVDGAAERVARLAESSLVSQFNSHPTVCLACTELPLAFPEQKMVAVFEHGSHPLHQYVGRTYQCST